MAEELKHKLKKYKAYLVAHPNGDKVCQVLRKLTSLPMSVALLQETGLGKAVSALRKREGQVGMFALQLISGWKKLVRESIRKRTPSSSSGDDENDKGRDEEDDGRSRGDDSNRGSEDNDNQSHRGDDDEVNNDGDSNSCTSEQERLPHHRDSGSDEEDASSGQHHQEEEEAEESGDEEEEVRRQEGSPCPSSQHDSHDEEQCRGSPTWDHRASGSSSNHSDAESHDKGSQDESAASEDDHRSRQSWAAPASSKTSEDDVQHDSDDSRRGHRHHMGDHSYSPKSKGDDRYSSKSKGYHHHTSGSKRDHHQSSGSKGEHQHNKKDQVHRLSPSHQDDNCRHRQPSSKEHHSRADDKGRHREERNKGERSKLPIHKSTSSLSLLRETLHAVQERTGHKECRVNEAKGRDKAISLSQHREDGRKQGTDSKAKAQDKVSESYRDSDHRKSSSHRGGEHRKSSSNRGSKHRKSSSHRGSEHITTSTTIGADKSKGDQESHRLLSKSDRRQSYKPAESESRNRNEADSKHSHLESDLVPPDADSDYEAYINRWVEDSVKEYQPGSVKNRAHSRSQSVEDYEELIDRQVDEDCAEYQPGTLGSHHYKGIRERSTSRTEHSQSPDDYSEFIARGLKSDCVEYKPGRKQQQLQHKSVKSSKELSPADYGEWIEQQQQFVKDKAQEYRPGSSIANKHISRVKQTVRDLSLSPDDYEEYINRDVKRDCVQYTPSSIGRQHQQEVGGKVQTSMAQCMDQQTHSSKETGVVKKDSGSRVTDSNRQKEKEKEKQRDKERETEVQRDKEREKEKQKEKEKQRDKERERQRDKEQERQREKEREKERQREKEREKQIQREKERGKERQREKEQEKERQREKEQEIQRDKERVKERQREKEQEKERQREKEQEKERQRQREKELEKERQREKELEKERQREKELEKEKEREKEQERERQREKEQERERQRDKEKERQRDKEREKERQGGKQPEKERQRNKEREKERQRDKPLEKERQRDKEREKEGSKDKERQKEKGKEHRSGDRRRSEVKGEGEEVTDGGKSEGRQRSSQMRSHHKHTDVDIILRPDGKLFQEPKDSRSSHEVAQPRKRPPAHDLSPSPSRSRSLSPASVDPGHSSDSKEDEPQPKAQDARHIKKEVRVEKTLLDVLHNTIKQTPVEGKLLKCPSTKKTSKLKPVDEKALIQSSLFASPDDYSVKVPAKKRPPPREESTDRRKITQSCSTAKNPKTEKSSARNQERSDLSLTETSDKIPSKDRTREKHGDLDDRPSQRQEHRSPHVPGKDTKAGPSSSSEGKSSDRSRGSSSGSKQDKQRQEESGDECENMTSFEDFLNYDDSKAVKRRKPDRSLWNVAATLGHGPVFPTQSKQLKLSTADIMSSLDEPSINYRPHHFQTVDSDRHRPPEDSMGTQMIVPKNTKTRTQVYSGRRHGLTKVDSLLNLCMQVLIKNIDSIEYMGPVPFHLLKPLLERCTAAQLYQLEDFNPHLLEDTDDLWKNHCRKDFRENSSVPDEMETWRELYLRKSEEREAKYVKLRENMSKTMTRGQSGNKVRMAYMDTVAKPPREVRRQQIRYGTAGIVRGGKDTQSASTSSGYRGAQSLKHKAYIPMKPQGQVPHDRQYATGAMHRPVGPMMEKTLKMLKNIRH